MTERCEASICIPEDHPSLPGHFPGAPLVPGVLLLDELVSAAERQLGRTLCITGLPQVKFLSPVLPGQRVHCALELAGDRLGFHLTRAGQPIARGSLRLSGPKPAGKRP
ncbi:MAG TPA: hypothetical protein VMD03_11805 [Steroidobacteraceae bacterium]|nr:hypothetical protein [Steroidobacteraceae bacterium]